MGNEYIALCPILLHALCPADLGSNKHHGNIDSWRTQVYPREAGVWPSGRTRESGPGGEGERTEGDGEIGLVWD